MSDSGRCRFTERAAGDLELIWDYIAKEAGAETAGDYIDELVRTVQSIANFPRMGRRRDELRQGWRSVVENPYVIFYREIENGIELMRIIHGSRDIPKALAEEETSQTKNE